MPEPAEAQETKSDGKDDGEDTQGSGNENNNSITNGNNSPSCEENNKNKCDPSNNDKVTSDTQSNADTNNADRQSTSRSGRRSRNDGDTDGRSSSMSSKKEGGKRQKRKGADIHKVTMTVTIAKAIPTVDDESSKLEDMVRKKKRIMEAPKAQSYYHCQYFLLPDDTDPVRTDVVTFGMAAKIYTENESKVLKTWQEGNQTWIAWSHSHTLKVTKELLLKMFNHKIELRIWDSKDMVSPRARFDRPKAFRIPQAKPGEDVDDIGGVKSLVLKQSQSYMSLQPKKSFSDRPVPQNAPPELKHLKHYGKTDEKGKPVYPVSNRGSPEMRKGGPSEDSNAMEAMQVRGEAAAAALMGKTASPQPPTTHTSPSGKSPTEETKVYNHLRKLTGITTPEPIEDPIEKELRRQKKKEEEMLSMPLKKQAAAPRVSPVKSAEVKDGRTPSGRSNSNSATTPTRRSKESPQQKEAKRKSLKAEQAAQALANYIRQHGDACIPIRMKLLFAGLKTVTNRLSHYVPGIADVFLTVSLDGPLMSEAHRKELNPLVIKLSSATNMPDTPLSHKELSRRCVPVFASYKFYKEPSYKSCARRHNKNIYWDDINVELLGNIPRGELLEYLNGPPLEIEVHDRDRRAEEIKQKPTLFGEDTEDDKISNVSMVTSKRTTHNPFKHRSKPWDPYGIAKFDLSSLLLGEKIMYMKSPIHNCPTPDLLGRNNKGNNDDRLMGVSNAADGPLDEPLAPGHYIDSDAQLKMRVEVAYPLTSYADVQIKTYEETPTECPFSRIIYLFEYKNTAFLHQLLKLLTQVNAKALNLDKMPQHIIEAALSTYKLSSAQQKSKDVDIITGFHIMDGEKHIFVLEGLRDEAVKLLWETLPRAKSQESTLFEVLYNSDLMFGERKYAALDVDLCRIRLHEPLSVIVQQPLLYVRDMVPKPCLDALMKLNQLIQQDKLRSVTKNDLFPSAEMIVVLSKEFGVPLSSADFEELREPGTGMLEQDRIPTAPVRRHREWTPLDIMNDEYLIYLDQKEKMGPMHDFVKENMNAVAEKSNENTSKKVKVPTVRADPASGVAHNYSTSKLNSTEQAKELLRQQLAQEPDNRFTYCQEYSSATVVPVNVSALKKQEEQASIDAWQTKDGFIYPGMENALDDNQHPKQPDSARRDELQKPWEENTLHANVLKPTLERERHTWDQRREDLDLWKKPGNGFKPIPPITIHQAGDTLAKERQECYDQDKKEWTSKLVVEDPTMKFHRLAAESELLDKGFKSSNQIDRLAGVLKDNPMKLSLQQGMPDIPALSVVNNPSVDTLAREAGWPIPVEDLEERERNCGFMPGPYDDKSWLTNKNTIPIKSMDHEYFNSMKGQDFKSYNVPHSNLHKRSIKPLSRDDKDNHLFRIRPPASLRREPKIRPGNECYLHPPPAIKPAPIRTEFYYPDREKFWKTSCDRDVTNRKQLSQPAV
ncbi:uncharacterized protein [Amphiura filiformis]|uniref:uncharacterized protein n=1 Tax=Amphiura filiformis TaxID=82378 RepID=UPI003B217374